MCKCPIGLAECKYPRNCFKTCNVCIRIQKQDELESMLLEAKIKSYNKALEDFEKCAIQQSLYTETEEGWSGMTIDAKTIKSIKEQLAK